MITNFGQQNSNLKLFFENYLVKSICIRSFSGRIFPHSDWIRRIQSKRRKIRTRKIPNTNTFHAVNISEARSPHETTMCPKCLIWMICRRFNPFHATDLFWYPLKILENQRFSDVFRGYQKRSAAWNALITTELNIYMKEVFDWYTATKQLWMNKYWKKMGQALFTIKNIGILVVEYLR